MGGVHPDIWLPTNKAGKLGDLQRQFQTKVGKLYLPKQALEAKEAALKAKNEKYCQLKLELGSL